MVHTLPPLHRLQAFEAAARLTSFKAAAAELGVTASAISHRLKSLESELGVALFERLNREVRLTETGRTLAQALHKAFGDIAAATLQATARQRSHRLQVSTMPFFAAGFLVPRLEGFMARHPDIELAVTSSMSYDDFARQPVDAAIRLGNGRWDGLKADRLIEPTVTPVLSEELLKRKPLRKPADLAQHTLIMLRGFETTWQTWFAAAGIPDLKPLRWLEMDGIMQTLQAAQHGLGVALTYKPLIVPAPLGVPLAMPFQQQVRLGRTLWLVYRPGDRGLPKIAAFRRWILGEIATLR